MRSLHAGPSPCSSASGYIRRRAPCLRAVAVFSLTPEPPLRQILVLDAHPRAQSYCDALSRAYATAAQAAGASVERLALRDLSFDPVLHDGYEAPQPLEPDLLRAQECLRAAQHLVLVYPVWWGTYPALLKGFLDRALTPGFAFRYTGPSTWERLLQGRSARVLLTMDWPPLANRFYLGAPSQKAMGRATLDFCGFKPVRFTEFGPVRGSTSDKREAWLAGVRTLAAKEAQG